MLYRFTIPIPNYYVDGVFHQHLYIEADYSPSRDEVLDLLRELDKRDSKFPEYTGEWANCIIPLETSIREWPTLGGRIIETNIFVEVPALNDDQTHPLSVKLIRPLRLDSPRSVEDYF